MSKEEQIRECQNKQLIDELLKDRGEFLKKRFNIPIDIPEVKERLDEAEDSYRHFMKINFGIDESEEEE